MVTIAPLPANELARLEALHSYCIVGTPADERFDLFTRMCTWVFHVPVAAINLVDADHTFFKSLIGFPTYRPRPCRLDLCARGDGGRSHNGD